MMYVPRHHAIDDLKADISQRLRPVCSHFPEDEFIGLVDQIAAIEHKYAQKAAQIVPKSYFADRAVEEKKDPHAGPDAIST